jgi:hypothetical protein
MNSFQQYGGCKECGSVVNACPSCGYCKEHHEMGIVEKITYTSPEQMNQGMKNLRDAGGKFAILAQLISGEIGFEEADKQLYAMNNKGI